MHDAIAIGSLLVRPSLNQIETAQGIRHIEPKVMQVLLLLARNPGEVISKDQFMRSVWGDVAVTEDVLTHAIYVLRRILEQTPKGRQIIETIPKNGYRLLSEAESVGTVP